MRVCSVASVMLDSLQPYGLSPAILPCPYDSSGRPPGGGHGNPLQYSCLKNRMGFFLLFMSIFPNFSITNLYHLHNKNNTVL